MISDWVELYQSFGYETEFNMLHDFYVVQKMSLREIGKLLRKSIPSVRMHLMQCNVKTRRRGGPNHRGSKLTSIPATALKNPVKAAEDFKVSLSSIYNERKRRREEPHGHPSGPKLKTSGG